LRLRQHFRGAGEIGNVGIGLAREHRVTGETLHLRALDFGIPVGAFHQPGHDAAAVLTGYLREPVDFIPRYPKNRVVVDLPRIKKIAFNLHKDRVAMFDRSGNLLTPTFMIAWVEAEGYVIQAFPVDDDGDGVAQDMIGCPCPKCRNR